MSAGVVNADTHFIVSHDGSDLAIRAKRLDAGLIVEEIHRVAKRQDLQGGVHLYLTDCDRLFILKAEAQSLSSGVPGDVCATCWAHLPVADVA